MTHDDRLKEACELVVEDLRAFVAAGCRYSHDQHLAVYQQALRHALSMRLLQTDGERYGEGMAARAFAIEDERDWLATLLERLRSAMRLSVIDLETSGRDGRIALRRLKEALS